MITRKLIAALVGLSLAAGSAGFASAQTATPSDSPAVGQTVSPADATAPSTGSDATAPAAKAMPKTTAKVGHKRMKAKHASKTRMQAKPMTRKHVSALRAGHAKVAGHVGPKPSTGKRVASHAAKRGTHKQG